MLKKYLVVIILMALMLVSYGEKDWLFLTIIGASNNLESAAFDDMNEMEVYGSNENIDIVTVVDRMSGYDSSHGNWTGTKAFHIQKDDDINTVTSPMVKDFGEINCGDANEIKMVIEWAIEAYPSEKLAINLWDHGSGPLISNPVVTYKENKRGILYDEESGNNLSNANLSDIMGYIYELREGRKTDILEFDACLMGMIEVSFETMDYVKLNVFSEETEPAVGNAYDDCLKLIYPYENLEAVDFGKAIVDSYVDQFTYSYGKITKSMISDEQSLYIVDAFDELVNYSLEDEKNIELWKNAINNSEDYAYPFVKDMYSLMKELQNQTRDGLLFDKAQHVINEIENVYDRQNSNCIYSKGVAIYAPSKSYNYKRERLTTLAFGKLTNWVKVLDKIFE